MTAENEKSNKASARKPWQVKHPIYYVWAGMKTRCNNPNRPVYPRYGGRGIKVCTRWMDYKLFELDMLPTWQAGLQIERINTDGHYEPKNWRWATAKEQNNNKRSNVVINYRGHNLTISEWADRTGINY